MKRKDRAYNLAHSMQDISEHVHDKYEMAKGYPKTMPIS